ncbi:hypothetical protein [Cerasicoccus frondis]|uniref:hypothetical protein n=1 Tax=Cerasicoccus frondis TaxID=490090 RepID=UPI002852C854|nr:hypothetical protein [Cerasicoccus frondis]
MSITQIIDEVDRLEPADRKRLMAHLVLRRLRENEAYRAEITRRIDDKRPGAWVSMEEFEARLKDN